MITEPEPELVPPPVYDRLTALEARGRLHPTKCRTRLWEQVRGSLPATSLPGGSRSANKPIPELDQSDRGALKQLADYARHISTGDKAFLSSLWRPSVIAYQRAGFIESAVLPELWMPTSEFIEWRREMSRQADEEASLRNMRAVPCSNCKRFVERTKDDPLCSGRCTTCYAYFKRTGTERPEELWTPAQEAS